MDENLNDTSGIEVEELEHESFEPITPDGHQRWQGQLRRAGAARVLPGPQRYRVYPAWLTEPHQNPAHEVAQA